jgi:hypothetical protein
MVTTIKYIPRPWIFNSQSLCSRTSARVLRFCTMGTALQLAVIGSIGEDPEAVLESFRISESGVAGPDPTCPTSSRLAHGRCMAVSDISDL